MSRENIVDKSKPLFKKGDKIRQIGNKQHYSIFPMTGGSIITFQKYVEGSGNSHFHAEEDPCYSLHIKYFELIEEAKIKVEVELKMPEFKVGDRVQIVKESDYYDRNRANPANTAGTIYRIDEDNPRINVQWDNGYTNDYGKTDLEFFKSIILDNKFKVGTVVKIRKDSSYYGRGHSNPADVSGKISEIGRRGIITVDWDNNTNNGYGEEDLEIVEVKENTLVEKVSIETTDLSESVWRKLMNSAACFDDFSDLLNEALTEASVDYPAGREAGHSISLDHETVETFYKTFVKYMGQYGKEIQEKLDKDVKIEYNGGLKIEKLKSALVGVTSGWDRSENGAWYTSGDYGIGIHDFIHPSLSGMKVMADLLTKHKEETTMSYAPQQTRRSISIKLIDDDRGLDVKDSLVHDFGQVVTEDSNEVTIQELISKGEIPDLLALHNEIRGSQVNLDILDRTGNEVYLRPVKLKNLRWEVK